MSMTRLSSALSAVEMLKATFGSTRATMTERQSDKKEQDSVLRKEYERLLRQLDRKPADAPQPSDIPPSKPDNSNSQSRKG